MLWVEALFLYNILILRRYRRTHLPPNPCLDRRPRSGRKEVPKELYRPFFAFSCRATALAEAPTSEMAASSSS